ncbi:MAG: flagellin FliC3, partial [Acetatifactor sp.]|nr:flagellin FliC3 [Acetatifactor sp.]
MRINYNVSAMISNNALSNNDNLLAKSLERLSSGLKINHGKDNPAGLAMAKRMNAQIEGLSMASQNASDGVSVIEIADGALSEVSDMLQRMNELSVKAATGTMSDMDRSLVQDEIAQLKEEITRISETTEFNGQKLLNGEFGKKGYSNTLGVEVSTYSDTVEAKKYTIENLAVTKNEDGTFTVDENTFVAGTDFPQGVRPSMRDGLLTLKDQDGFEMTLDLTDASYDATGNLVLGTDENGDPQKVEVDILGIGAMRLQIGANEGQVLAVDIPNMSLRNIGIEHLDVGTQQGALDGIDRLSD